MAAKREERGTKAAKIMPQAWGAWQKPSFPEGRGQGLAGCQGGPPLLFGVPDHRSERGASGSEADGPVEQSIRAIKSRAPDLLVMTDVCLCEHGSHGHCGVPKDGGVLNGPTPALLAGRAVSRVEAGAGPVAPSGMMGGRVAAIREALDGKGHAHIPIMSYSTKCASAFYGPFRDAAGSCPKEGDPKGYRMDPGNIPGAILETEPDL